MSEGTIRLPKVSSAPSERRVFIGGSDARVIMGAEEAALLRLWQEKRGELEPEDLSGNLIVQLGLVTEASTGIGSKQYVELVELGFRRVSWASRAARSI